MIVLRRGLGIGAVLASLFVAPAAAQTGTITGRLTGADTGRPLVGALVEAVADGGAVSGSGLSNQDGVYRITNLPAGTYTVRVSAVGYGSQDVQTVQVTAGGTSRVDATVDPRAIPLDQLVITGSRKPEKALDSPARVEVINAAEIEVRPAVTPVDHLRSDASVDIITAGVQSSFVVVRGFNNIFSGALHTLTDNRIAGIPSLRVNLLHFIPQTDDDFERMEVVMGPGSALYGPNTANGVLHIITKSPLDDPGTVFSISGGEQSALQVTGRTAHALSDRFGFKLSGQYFRANEWEFRDPVELAAREQATNDFARWAATQPFGPDDQPLSPAELQQRASRLAARDFDVARWAFDARADWRPSGEFGAVFSAGLTSAAKGIELTGIGAAQVKDWLYSYYQARFNYRNWFGQVYLNASDAGETFLLRTGAPIVDESKVFVTQLQHSAQLGNRLDFVYGADFIRTMPQTGRTINGSREDDDNFNQFGLYLQTRATVSPKLDLVAAVREDWHTELNDPVFSPRAAVVFKPAETQTLRLTYNRAFSTPSSLNLFLDIDGGPAGELLGPFGFRVRAQGPGKDGIRLVDASGNPLGMRSPFLGQPAALMPVSASSLYELQVRGLIAASAAQGQPIPAQLQQYMLGLAADPAVAGMTILGLNPTTQQVGPLAGQLSNVPGIEPSLSSTIEFGYKGIIGDRLLLAADVWRSEESDFTSPLVVRTPLLLLNPQQLAPFIVQRLVQAQVPQQQAEAIAQNLVQLPGAVASSEDVAARGTDLLATYVNFGEVDLWGADVSATYLLNEEWSAGVTASFVSEHNFCLTGQQNGVCPTEQLVALNAPRQKGTLTLSYRGATNGFNAQARVRHLGEFPVNSADYIGIACIVDDPTFQGADCVESSTLFDLTLGYRLPNIRGAEIQLGVTNLFNEPYRSFVGVPAVGRMALLRLRYSFN